jgi:methylaspartate mutase epsilon subunit
MNLQNKKWTDEQFYAIRKEILHQWPTGSEVDLQDGIRYQQSIP